MKKLVLCIMAALMCASACAEDFAGARIHVIGRTDLRGGDDGEMRDSLARLYHLPYDDIVYPGQGSLLAVSSHLSKHSFQTRKPISSQRSMNSGA